MEAPKVTLSEAEHRLLADANLILTKNSVIDKICRLFGESGNDFYEHTAGLRSKYPGIFGLHPKVSKGEKHQDLPWVMLDYPRYFDREGHLAIRCFCWWGNYYSIQLHVSGNFLPSFLHVLEQMPSFAASGWLMGLTSQPWDLQLPPNNWLPLSHAISSDSALFLKMAKKIPIDEWENLEKILWDAYRELIQLTNEALGTNPVK